MPHLDIAIVIIVLAPATKGMAEVLTHMSPAASRLLKKTAWTPFLREYGHSCSCSPDETLPGRASRLGDTAGWGASHLHSCTHLCVWLHREPDTERTAAADGKGSPAEPSQPMKQI